MTTSTVTQNNTSPGRAACVSPSIVPLGKSTAIGDQVRVPGKGLATVIRFFGFTEDGILKHFVTVKLDNGESVCLQIHDI